MKEYIPVQVYVRTKNDTWYMDISNMGLGELIKLKNQLIGTKGDSGICTIDSIIYNEHCTSKFYYDNVKDNCRKHKREAKKTKYKIRKNCKEFAYGGEERW